MYYSDLFGRPTPGAEIVDPESYHPKHQYGADGHLIINSEWTDSRTEIMRRPGTTEKTTAQVLLKECPFSVDRGSDLSIFKAECRTFYRA